MRILKFGLVGASGVIVDFGVTYLCKELLGTNPYVANSLGFALAATANYFLNKRWTFEDKSQNVLQQYGVFLLISLVGLGLNNGIIFLLKNYFAMNFYVAKVIAIGVVFFWNYFANAKLTFRG